MGKLGVPDAARPPQPQRENLGRSCCFSFAQRDGAAEPVPGVTALSLLGELSPCRVNNGGCQDLCLLTPKGHVNCSCRGERVLQEDFTCKGGNGSRWGRDGAGEQRPRSAWQS